MYGLTRIFLEVCAEYSYRENRSILEGYIKHTIANNRCKKLTNLVALWQIRVEVILSVEP